VDEEKAFVDPRLMAAVSHPVRADFLRLLAEHKELSPLAAQKRLGEKHKVTLSQLTYHVGMLERSNLIESTGERAAAGGLQLIATAKGEDAMAVIGAAVRDDLSD
jgi:DNA-binding MarR family transcriptional regulator